MNLHQGVSALPESSNSSYIALQPETECVWLMDEERFIKYLKDNGTKFNKIDNE